MSRSLKYAFLIRILTYISVLFTKIVMKRNILLLNYFLIGAALILFYSLLLSFSEHLSSGLSYLIAACMTVALIPGYMWKMIAPRKAGIVMVKNPNLVGSLSGHKEGSKAFARYRTIDDDMKQ